MAKQRARELLLKIGDGATPTEAFSTLCGLTTKTLTINNNVIDITTPDKTTPGGQLWSDVMTGMRSMSLSGSGIFEDDASEERFRVVAFGTGQTDTADAAASFQVILPDFGTFKGAFHVNSAEYGGEDQEGAVTYSLELQSKGAVTWTAA